MTKKDKEKEATSDAMIQRKAPVKIEKKVAETEDEEATSDEKIEKLEARIKQLEASLSGDFNKAARAIPRLAEKLTSLKISDDMSIDTKNKFYSIAGEIEKSIEQLRGLVH